MQQSHGPKRRRRWTMPWALNQVLPAMSRPFHRTTCDGPPATAPFNFCYLASACRPGTVHCLRLPSLVTPVDGLGVVVVDEDERVETVAVARRARVINDGRVGRARTRRGSVIGVIGADGRYAKGRV